MSEEVKVEAKEEIKVVENKVETIKSEDVKVDYSDIFVSESDTFNVTVSYYKKDNTIFIKGLDEEYDEAIISKSFSMTFRYPNQKDFTEIGTAGRGISLGQEITIKEFILLEFSRLIILLKSWTLNQPIASDIISKMHPKIVKYITTQIRTTIGMDGII